MPRLVLTDAQWVAMEPHCLGKAGDRGRSGTDNRLFVEAMRWKARTSSPWRDLPEMVGTWNVVWRRFDDWCKAGVWERMFEAVSDDSDMEYAMVDATIVPVHRRGHGAKGGPQRQAAGASKGGWTTKILALTDALDNLVRFEVLPGHRYDTIGVALLIKGVEFAVLIADKAFDANWIVQEMDERGAKVVISQRPQRLAPRVIDEDIYQWRHLIESFFAKLKELKAIAMRAGKTDRNFRSMIALVAAVLRTR
ncbi:MAG: IS5 family transposase [Pseudomonadota bacterium]